MNKWIIGRDKPEAIFKFIRKEADSTNRELVVCFDYFDTVVTRCVEPEHTKRLASHLLSRLLKGNFDKELLYSLRKDIEYRLCQINAENSQELEFRFEDLGATLWTELINRNAQCILPDRDLFIKDLLAIEVAVEKAVQHVCPEVFEVLLALHRLEFKLLLISDFYLPEKEFKEMVAWCKLEHFFSKVYVSSAYGRSKGSGRIFPMICEDLGIESGQLLMIGDNPHADIVMAHQHGLKTIHLQRQNSDCITHLCKKTDIPSLDRSGLFKQIVLPKDICFPEIGFSFWLFIHRLFEELNKNNVQNVFFLSKEGEFLKKVFEQYQIQLFGSLKIKSHYLLASRKATFITSLRSLDVEDFSRLFDHYHDISIRDFLQSLNFDDAAIGRICEKMSNDCDRRLSNIRHHPDFRELLKLKLFRDDFEARRKEQRNNFLRYLGSFEVDYRREGLHLVDVGWKGSIQDNIYYSLAAEISIQGYYIGSLNATERVAGNRKKGLLFDNFPHPTPFFNVFNSNRSLFEMVLGASHGSASLYRSLSDDETGETSAVVMNVGVDTGGRHPLVLTHYVPEEQQLFKDHIEPLQQKLLKLCAEMNRAYMLHGNTPSSEWFARHHARMVFHPKKAEIDWFESLYHYENFGVFELTKFATSHNFKTIARLRNLKNIVKDPTVLESGVWPPIILRRFGVGFWQIIDGLRRYHREFGKHF
ncbi:MAG: HAD-IA family hydrolase [Pseudomonadota bacterium]